MIAASWIGGEVANAIAAGPRESEPDGGRLLGSFTGGAYFGFGSRIVAVTDPTVPPGPLNLTLAEAGGNDLLLGDAAVWGRSLRFGTVWVDIADATSWAPTHDRSVVTGQIKAITGLEQCRDVPSDIAAAWPAVAEALTSEDLTAVRQLLGGRGSGLTPTGDDVLAGLVLGWALMGRRDHDDLVALVASTRTGDLSLRFLHWAAQGISIEPVHRLISAGPDDRSAAADALCAIGGSSGQAVLFGLAASDSLGQR